MTAILVLCVVCFAGTGPEPGWSARRTVDGSPGEHCTAAMPADHPELAAARAAGIAPPGFICRNRAERTRWRATGTRPNVWIAIAPTSSGQGAYAIPFAGGKRDPWFASDKLRHFLTAFAVTGYAHAGLRALDLDQDAAVAGGIAISLAAGIGKEIHDVRVGTFFSLRDLLWDAAGALAGALLVSAAR